MTQVHEHSEKEAQREGSGAMEREVMSGAAWDSAPTVPLERIAQVSGSTQDLARQRLRSGAQAPFAVLTRDQRTGRGRLGRQWAAPPGHSIALTLAHRSRITAEQRGWYALAVGVAVLEAVHEVFAEIAVPALGLKWPNDVLTAEGTKLAGILCEADGTEHVLVGVGLNLRDPGIEGAAWLFGGGGLLGGAEVPGEDQLSPDDRLLLDPPESRTERLEQALADRIESALTSLDAAGGNAESTPLAERYRMMCVTLNRGVRVRAATSNGTTSNGTEHKGSEDLTGQALAVDSHGQLIVATDDGRKVHVHVGDVLHVRPVDHPS